MLLAIGAAAAFVMLTAWSKSPSPGDRILDLTQAAKLVPAAMLAFACVILLAARFGGGRRAPSVPQSEWPPVAAAPDPVPPPAPSQAPTPQTATPAAAGSAAPPDLRQTNAALQKLGFDDSFFADPEPVRSMPALPDSVSIMPIASDALTEHAGLAPEDTLETPGASAAERKAQGQTRAAAVPFGVLDPNASFVLIAMMGGDNNLSAQVKNDIGEMAAGSARYGHVAALVLADTETGPGTVLEVTPSGQLRTIEQLSEIDTGDPETLAQFLTRALITYPNARKAIGFWDHGSGVFEESDKMGEVLLDRSVVTRERLRTPARRLLLPRAQREALKRDPGTRAMLHDNSGGVLTNLEAGRMLRAAYGRAGQQQRADILYSDTCLNGMIEVLEELSDFAHCVVASCDTEPPPGWDYEEWIRRTAFAIPAGPADWARHAVQAFGTSYQGQTQHYPCTLGAYFADNEITEAFAALVAVSDNAGLEAFSLLNLARSRAQGYASRDTYDLANFAAILARASAGRVPKLEAAANTLVQECARARIDSVALGPTVTASQGLAFWFPSSRRSLGQDIATYRRLKFNRLTNWGEYLSKMYQDDGVG